MQEGQPGTTDLGKGASLLYVPRAWNAAEAEALRARLEHEVPWEQKEIKILGKKVMQPRLVAYSADHLSLSVSRCPCGSFYSNYFSRHTLSFSQKEGETFGTIKYVARVRSTLTRLSFLCSGR